MQIDHGIDDMDLDSMRDESFHDDDDDNVSMTSNVDNYSVDYGGSDDLNSSNVSMDSNLTEIFPGNFEEDQISSLTSLDDAAMEAHSINMFQKTIRMMKPQIDNGLIEYTEFIERLYNIQELGLKT